MNESAIDEIEEMKGELEDAYNENDELTKEIRKLRSERPTDKDKIAELTETKTKQDRDLAVLRQNLANRMDEHEESVKRFEALEIERDEKKAFDKKVATLEEQLRQAQQSETDLNEQINRQKEIIDKGEDVEAATEKLETLQEQLKELQEQKTKIEKELGLTTKEKVKRALTKIGIPAAIAAAIAAAVGIIMSALGGVGKGIKAIGKGFAEMGKKMTSSVPGLLGAALGAVLRTGSELLKFLGNNIWILVVAIGAIMLKKLNV